MANPQQIVYGTFASPSYAGLMRRIGAYILDVLLAFAVVIAVALTMRFFRAVGIWTPSGGRSFQPEEAWHMLGVSSKLLIVVAFAVSQGAFYFTFFEASPWQATIGKLVRPRNIPPACAFCASRILTTREVCNLFVNTSGGVPNWALPER